MSAQALCFLATQPKCLKDSGLRYTVDKAEVQHLNCLRMALQAQIHKTAGVDKTFMLLDAFGFYCAGGAFRILRLSWQVVRGGSGRANIHDTEATKLGMPSVHENEKHSDLKLRPAPGWHFWLSALSSTSQVLPICGLELL